MFCCVSGAVAFSPNFYIDSRSIAKLFIKSHDVPKDPVALKTMLPPKIHFQDVVHELNLQTAVAASGEDAKSENQMSLVFTETATAHFPFLGPFAQPNASLAVDDQLFYDSDNTDYTLTASESVLWQRSGSVFEIGANLCNMDEEFRGTKRCVEYLY